MSSILDMWDGGDGRAPGNNRKQEMCYLILGEVREEGLRNKLCLIFIY